MAERRMVSKKIVDSDAFMDMALSTQALYFHLLARADDDGFVGNPKKIMRMVGAGDDEYKVLIVKRFILQFPSGVCVIKHWLIHNLIRADRYNSTQYIEEKNSLEVKENKAYTEMATNVIPDGNHLATQVSLGKVRIDKISTEEQGGYSLDFEQFWSVYPEKKGKGKAYESWLKIKGDKSKIIEAIKVQDKYNHFKGKDGKDYIPHPTTWLNQKRWEDEVKVKRKETVVTDGYKDYEDSEVTEEKRKQILENIKLAREKFTNKTTA